MKSASRFSRRRIGATLLQHLRMPSSKTVRITPLSALAALHKMAAPLRVGT